MAGDILYDPLGGGDKHGKPGGRGIRRTVLPAVALVVAVGAIWIWQERGSSVAPDGVVARIEAAKPAPALPHTEIAAKAILSAGDVEDESGVKIVRPPGFGASGATIIKVPQDLAVALQPAPDLRLVEKTHFGLLPARGSDGARAADVYARPVVTDPGLKPNAPRIALLIGGMGLNAPLTVAASTELPPAVTLGFAPYGNDLDRQVQGVREAGHEVVLQVPMEGFGDPSSASMSHLLTADLEGKDLLDRLHWHMGRFVGYVGVANFLGGKFTADEGSFAPVLRDVAGRGLLYLDDGSSTRSLAPTLASGLGLPFARADVVLDASNDPKAIDAALDRLVALAKDKGSAIGVASGLPAAINRIASFAQKLGDRGIALVPVSALTSTQPTASRMVAQP